GFDGVQLGPQGQTSRGNPCPYDGQLYTQDFLSVALQPLVQEPYWEGLLTDRTISRIADGRPDTDGWNHHEYAWDQTVSALDEIWQAYQARGRRDTTLDRDLRTFRHSNADWLDLTATAGDASPERHAFVQFVLHHQHRQLRSALPGLRFFGDLQIGMSPAGTSQFTRSQCTNLFHPDYFLGAPPSRTNPDGQPWGYAVFHPDQVATGNAGEFLRNRVRRLLDGCDGIRIDHPHGLVCPWVYRRDVADSGAAVRTGARLHGSPALEDHPDLSAFSIVRPEQIDRTAARYAENRVRSLDEDQVTSFSALFDVIPEAVRESGGDPESDIACEVLSTLPFPLGCVMQRHGLGRFRVIQKARLDDPADVYRIENAEPADWIMMGNHDTPPIWLLAQDWCDGGKSLEWAEYLADRLSITTAGRREFVKQTAASPGALVHAMFAALLASRAGHVAVFFSDLLGLNRLYNRPGVVSDQNWRLRVPSDYARHYRLRRTAQMVLDVPACLRLAVAARERMGRRPIV
ncbi:MAG: 4-alpha-glucanotransferase, partial [Planctomycetaceae bacterium]